MHKAGTNKNGVGIEVTGVSFRYAKAGPDVLRNVSISFLPGHVTALLGPNGCGKTTLLRLLMGALRDGSNTITIDSRDIDGISGRELGTLIAWVPQSEEATFPFIVEEYVLMGRAPYLGLLDMPSEKDRHEVGAILAELGISTLARRPMTDLSGGQQRLVSLARAMSQGTPVVALDEPATHLDMANKTRLLRILRKMADKGKTVIFSTHDPNEALMIADVVALIKDRKIMHCGPPEEVMDAKTLGELFGTQVAMMKRGGEALIGPSMALKKQTAK